METNWMKMPSKAPLMELPLSFTVKAVGLPLFTAYHTSARITLPGISVGPTMGLYLFTPSDTSAVRARPAHHEMTMIVSPGDGAEVGYDAQEDTGELHAPFDVALTSIPPTACAAVPHASKPARNNKVADSDLTDTFSINAFGRESICSGKTDT